MTEEKTAEKTEDVYKTLNCLFNFMRNPDLRQVAEGLLIHDQLISLGDKADIVEYSMTTGHVARTIASMQRKTAILFESEEAAGFTSELLKTKIKDKDQIRNTALVFSPCLPISERAFAAGPQGGWGVIVIRDLIANLENEQAVIQFLSSVAGTMFDGALLLLETSDHYKHGSSHTEGYGNLLMTEHIEKIRMKSYERKFTARGDANCVHNETIQSYNVGDLGACCREVGLKLLSADNFDKTRYVLATRQ